MPWDFSFYSPTSPQFSTNKQRQQARTAKDSAGQTEAKPSAKQQTSKAKASTQREAKVTAGLVELELWLRDLIRQGLAAVQTQPNRYWENMAVAIQRRDITQWAATHGIVMTQPG